MREIEFGVVGGGPAGLSAAIEAAKCGVKVAVFDENERPGGQLLNKSINSLGRRSTGPGSGELILEPRCLRMRRNTGLR